MRVALRKVKENGCFFPATHCTVQKFRVRFRNVNFLLIKPRLDEMLLIIKNGLFKKKRL